MSTIREPPRQDSKTLLPYASQYARRHARRLFLVTGVVLVLGAAGAAWPVDSQRAATAIPAAAEAQANHVARATYTGTNSAGGTVAFTVSTDGASLSHVKVAAPSNVLCELFPSSGIEFADIPIANHAFNGRFSRGSYEGFFRGSFPGTKSATGTFGMEIAAGIFTCDRETWSWTATTSGAPPAPKCLVPSVKGRFLATAKQAIASAHCKTGKIKRAFSTKVARNRVIAQQPAPGTRLGPGGKVNLVVSRGRKP